MATPLSKPVTRELSAEQTTQLLDLQANRGLVVTMGTHGITLKAKGRQGAGVLVPWKKIVGSSWDGMGLNQFRKELR